MGEYADEAVDRLLFGGGRRSRRPTPTAVCKRCGKGDLTWRFDDTGAWRLYDNERVQPGNYKPLHTCGPDPSTDFD